MSDTPAAGTVLALWNDVTPELDADYNDWHANEHVPERLTVPGMLWGRRYAAPPGNAGPRYLTLYGLRDVAVLDSDAYRRLLAEPTPASARMRPHLRNISRWVCDVRAMRGTLETEGLIVRTFDAEGAAQRGLAEEAAEAQGALLAERLPDAAPLPWLRGGQEQAIRGQWLLALAQRDRQAVPAAGTFVYRALPVSTAWHHP